MTAPQYTAESMGNWAKLVLAWRLWRVGKLCDKLITHGSALRDVEMLNGVRSVNRALGTCLHRYRPASGKDPQP